MKIITNNMIMDLTFPHVMGILNVTPDSFSDGGHFNQYDKALRHADEMVQAGATFIDIGGESTRPGASEVTVGEELDRVIPIIDALSRNIEVWISVDTSKPEVMTEAAKSGAHLINDIRALQWPGAVAAAAATELPVVLMHMKGDPTTMQKKTYYDDVVKEVSAFFLDRIVECEAAGIKREKIILDPGFGFGKSLTHNYQLLARLPDFHRIGLPLLVGMSRKSMVGQLLNVAPPKRLIGSVACATIAALYGAKIIRVHDVKETVDAIRVVQATLSEKEAVYG